MGTDLVWKTVRGRWDGNSFPTYYETKIPVDDVEKFIEEEGKRHSTSFHKIRGKKETKTSFSQTYCCSYGPEDHTQKKPGRRVRKEKKGGSIKRGCQAHFDLIVEKENAGEVLVRYKIRDHRNKDGKYCHGKNVLTPDNPRLIHAPRIGEDLRSFIQTNIRLGRSDAEILHDCINFVKEKMKIENAHLNEDDITQITHICSNCGVGANMLDTEIDDTTPAGPSQPPENLDNSGEMAPECLADLWHESSTKGGDEAPEFSDENSAPDQDTTRKTGVRHKSNLKLLEEVREMMMETNDQLVDGFISANLKRLLEGGKQLQAKGQHHKPNPLVRREDENGWSLKRLKPFFERGSNRMKKKEQNQLGVEPFRSNVSKRPKLPLMAEVREASLKEQKRRRTGEERSEIVEVGNLDVGNAADRSCVNWG